MCVCVCVCTQGFAKGKATPLLATLFKEQPAEEECVWPSELAGGPVTPGGRRRRRMQEVGGVMQVVLPALLLVCAV